MQIAFPRWWPPPNGALHGLPVDHLMNVSLAWMGGIFLLVHALLLLALLQRGGGPRRLRRWLLYETVPLAIICGLFAWMTLAADRLWSRDRYSGAAPGAMQVEVVGAQFQWYFRYPGEDAAFGRTMPELADAAQGNPLGIDPGDSDGRDDIVASELVLPMGREVDLRLRAHDVIHGFFIPGMRLKQNAVPGMVLHIHFTPVRSGEYPILCSQLCGLGHARMQTRLRVVPAEDYAAWLHRETARRETAAQPAPRSAE